MYLLIDECCAKCLVRCCEQLGHTAQRTVNVRVLGKGATDSEIFDFCVRNEAVLVTENARDFIVLGRRRKHPGMIFVPAVQPREQASLLRVALREVASKVFNDHFSNIFIEATEDGRVVSFE